GLCAAGAGEIGADDGDFSQVGFGVDFEGDRAFPGEGVDDVGGPAFGGAGGVLVAELVAAVGNDGPGGRVVVPAGEGGLWVAAEAGHDDPRADGGGGAEVEVGEGGVAGDSEE